MKVLGATINYPPASRVGSWLATHQYLRHMAAKGHEVAVLSRDHRGLPYAIDDVVVESGAAGRRSTRPQWADVIVTHCGDTGRGGLAASAGRPSVRFAHGHISESDVVEADLVAWNSESIRGGRPGIVCRPPTVAVDHLVERTGDHVTLVNLTRDKGLKTAWDASEMLPHHRFLGVKGGYGHQETPRPPNWTTWPTQPDMRRVWAETRILLMPSAYETWGMVGVEAMTNGIPVIAHPTPGLSESLGDAGIFVDRDDPMAWADEISRLDDPGEYEVASKAARKRAEDLQQIFAADLDRFADAVEALCS